MEESLAIENEIKTNESEVKAKEVIVIHEEKKHENKIIKAWLLFQKHAFNYVLFILVGFLLGVMVMKTYDKKQIEEAIILQRFLYKINGTVKVYEIQPSSIRMDDTSSKMDKK